MPATPVFTTGFPTATAFFGSSSSESLSDSDELDAFFDIAAALPATPVFTTGFATATAFFGGSSSESLLDSEELDAFFDIAAALHTTPALTTGFAPATAFFGGSSSEALSDSDAVNVFFVLLADGISGDNRMIHELFEPWFSVSQSIKKRKELTAPCSVLRFCLEKHACYARRMRMTSSPDDRDKNCQVIFLQRIKNGDDVKATNNWGPNQIYDHHTN
ncbi:unnamed protein product [Schistocephalus solidus]|uniref:Uncharacterized protein n=1 Tax=Schistocephalus solidus TaxID=70667 RepID=A0A3P7BXA6_SCHSO|nr:unnamed protein product [Schistocephalus solidus]